jgi:hypothetical protein
MATNPNQREGRVPAPKIPAVIAKPTAPTYNPLSGMVAKPAAPSTFTYGLGNPLETRVTKPGQTLPTTTVTSSGSSSRGSSGSKGSTNKTPGGTTDGTGDTGNTGDGGTNTGDTKPKEDTTEDASLTYAKMQDEKARQDAFALLKDVFNSYGLSELAAEIESYMREGIGTSQATLRLKQSTAYKERFYGNELRRNAGLNVIDEASYLDLENSYSETLKAYGLQDYFGVGVTPNERKNRQKAIADVIGKDISAVEFKDRVSTAVDRVKMADPATKSAFQQFYGIGEADLAKYFLDPSKSLVTLKEKATAAEIGGAAIGQGLPATAASAEDLAKFGISREQAQVGYSTIAEELPTATKLGQIYDEEGITYGQTEAEAATFKGLASAKRKREQLKAREEAAFQGSSGVAPAGLKTTYLRQSSSAGYF